MNFFCTEEMLKCSANLKRQHARLTTWKLLSSSSGNIKIRNNRLIPFSNGNKGNI